MFAGLIQYCADCWNPLSRPVFQLEEMSVVVDKIRIPKFVCEKCMEKRKKETVD